MIAIYIYATVKGNISIYFGKNDVRNYKGKVKEPFLSKSKAEIIAAMIALERAGKDQDIIIMSSSHILTYSMNHSIKRGQSNDWSDYKGQIIENKDLFMKLLTLEKSIIDHGYAVYWVNMKNYETAIKAERQDGRNSKRKENMKPFLNKKDLLQLYPCILKSQSR